LIETAIPGAWIVEPEPIEDDRGFFARTWCREEFEARGLNADLAQCSISFNRRRGVLRGMHYQAAPHEEAKLVRVTRGAVYDVAVDLRPDSGHYLDWVALELTSENRKAFYIPEGCAHGFQTLEDETEVLYQISRAVHPASARGIRWDDPAIGIKWPFAPSLVSTRDLAFPLLSL
jgi:dTDP-4-dehydrorhamnose 3,5-epimerase